MANKNKINKLLVVANAILVALLVIIISFSLYRRYSEVFIYDKPAEVDGDQLKIEEDNDLSSDVSSQVDPTETSNDDGSGHFTLYSVGDAFIAPNGNGKLSCDIQNKSDSTHDIVASFYISREELSKHNLSTSGIQEDRWLIAQTGLFEPGYQITSVQLLALPDGSYLPAGTYNLTMIEKYYHHETGELSAYDANIPVTLEVAE